MESPDKTPEIDDRAAEDLDKELGRLEREGDEATESSEQGEELEDGDV